MTINLLPNYARLIASLSESELQSALDKPELILDSALVGSKTITMSYAPFDHVNRAAKVVIVGLTPGRQQATNALKAARLALNEGLDPLTASERAKVVASFSGPMRSNLVRMFDSVGLSRRLGLDTAARLWTDKTELAHFTSLLRYPVFVDGKDWSGQPDAVRTNAMRKWLDAYTAEELSELRGAVLVPLGPKVAEGLRYLAELGKVEERLILTGLPHPSGANAERIACFLGDKPPHLVSVKTNADALLTARKSIMARVEAI